MQVTYDWDDGNTTVFSLPRDRSWRCTVFIDDENKEFESAAHAYIWLKRSNRKALFNAFILELVRAYELARPPTF